ncbi:MAG: hypothetical protein ACP5OG_01600 [Candidatus Nanoarchaeia archaeon]
MRVSPAEIIDRYSILKLKIERIKDPYLNKELEELKKAIEEFKREGIKIQEEWIEELYNTNRDEWDLLDNMNKERKKIPIDYAVIGKIYLETELVNKKRSQIKNRIIEETEIGFKEIKKNHPSE